MRQLPLLSWFLCAACGGGGGGSGATPTPAGKLQGGGAGVGPNDTTVSLDVTLASVPAGTALLQFDVIVDPIRLGPSTGRAPLEALQSRPTADSNDLGGGTFRVVIGDDRNTPAAPLTTGPIARVWLE